MPHTENKTTCPFSLKEATRPWEGGGDPESHASLRWFKSSSLGYKAGALSNGAIITGSQEAGVGPVTYPVISPNPAGHTEKANLGLPSSLT